MIKVLMTGAGAPGGPGIIKGLKKNKNIDLLVCDANPDASGRFLNEKFEILPMANEDIFIEKLLNLCKRYNIDVVFPLVTRELFKLSKHKELFKKEGVKVVVSNYENLKIANDKSALCIHLEQKGIMTPDFKVVNTIEELKKAFTYLGYPKKPVCIKPSVSNGSRGVRIIDGRIDEYDLLFNYKPNSLYMTYEKLFSILEDKEFPELLVSEYLPGEEYTIDTIVQKGEVKVVLPRKRTKMNGGISVAGRFEENVEIINYCTKIINSLDLEGPIGLQVKKSVEGKYKILEINPRIQGTSIAALGTGVNLPLLAIYAVLDRELKIPPIKWDTKFTRYYEELFY